MNRTMKNRIESTRLRLSVFAKGYFHASTAYPQRRFNKPRRALCLLRSLIPDFSSPRNGVVGGPPQAIWGRQFIFLRPSARRNLPAKLLYGLVRVRYISCSDSVGICRNLFKNC